VKINDRRIRYFDNCISNNPRSEQSNRWNRRIGWVLTCSIFCIQPGPLLSSPRGPICQGYKYTATMVLHVTRNDNKTTVTGAGQTSRLYLTLPPDWMQEVKLMFWFQNAPPVQTIRPWEIAMIGKPTNPDNWVLFAVSHPVLFSSLGRTWKNASQLFATKRERQIGGHGTRNHQQSVPQPEANITDNFVFGEWTRMPIATTLTS